MKEQDVSHPDFPQWIKSKAGIDCMKWPVGDEVYLFNRLSWAFDAGRNCVWDQYINQKLELTRLRSELQQERELRKELVEGLEYAQDVFAARYPDPDLYIDSLIEKAKLNN